MYASSKYISTINKNDPCATLKLLRKSLLHFGSFMSGPIKKKEKKRLKI